MAQGLDADERNLILTDGAFLRRFDFAQVTELALHTRYFRDSWSGTYLGVGADQEHQAVVDLPEEFPVKQYAKMLQALIKKEVVISSDHEYY